MAECYTPISYSVVLRYVFIRAVRPVILAFTAQRTGISAYLYLKRVECRVGLTWVLCFPLQARFVEKQPVPLLPRLQLYHVYAYSIQAGTFWQHSAFCKILDSGLYLCKLFVTGCFQVLMN
jgi:hypothetical protein